MTSDEILVWTRNFLKLQTSLLAAFFEQYPDVKDTEFLLDFPRNGLIKRRDEGDEWKFQKHGLGIDFCRLSDGVLINVETSVRDPSLVTAWRLWEYIDSVSSDLAESWKVEGDISSLLDLLSARGLLAKSKDGYRMISTVN